LSNLTISVISHKKTFWSRLFLLLISVRNIGEERMRIGKEARVHQDLQFNACIQTNSLKIIKFFVEIRKILKLTNLFRWCVV